MKFFGGVGEPQRPDVAQDLQQPERIVDGCQRVRRSTDYRFRRLLHTRILWGIPGWDDHDRGVQSPRSAAWPSGRSALGAWVKIPAVEVIELLALSGLDFVVIDCEHGVHDRQTVSTMIVVARGCGIAPFVRVAGLASNDIAPMLDAGAVGLFVPHVNSVEEAREVAALCRFPPLGRRGAGPTSRVGSWGHKGLSRYLSAAADTTVVVQLESLEALADGPAIAAVAGIDAVFVGPVDLGVSAGLDPDGGRLRAVITEFESAARAAGAMTGTTAATAEQVVELSERGHRLIVVGNDCGFLLRGAEQIIQSSRLRAPSPPAATEDLRDDDI